MSIIANAKLSIELGLEDFQSKDDRRLISSVRNFHSGVLLLLKEKLLRLSPPDSNEVLIKQRIIPKVDSGGKLIFVGEARKTVDIFQIKDRFKTLGISFDWNRFDKMTDLRNDLEHYYSSTGRDAIRGLVSDTFILVRDFVREELKEDPGELLGLRTWRTLTEAQEVYEKERSECINQLERVGWESPALLAAAVNWSCPACGSLLVIPEDPTKTFSRIVLKCRSCAETYSFEQFAVVALSDHFAGYNHRSIKEGGDPATTTCPFCHEDGYVLDEERCALCGEHAEHVCARCGCRIPESELNDGSFCGYCEHMMDKD